MKEELNERIKEFKRQIDLLFQIKSSNARFCLQEYLEEELRSILYEMDTVRGSGE